MADQYITWGILFFVASLATAAVLHFYYVRRSYRTFPPLTHACIIVSVFVCIMPFPLLLLDVSAGDSAVRAGADANPERWFKGMWLFIFFATQVLAWIVLPILQEFDNAGEFSARARASRAVRENVKMYVILGVTVGALMGYIIFLKGVTTPQGILSLILAAANAFGLLLLTVFLSCGLVGLPRMLWRSADPMTMLRRYYFDATDIHEDVDVAAMDLADVKAQLAVLTPLVAEEDAAHLHAMLERIQAADEQLPLYHTASSRTMMSSAPSAADVSRSKLERLNAKMKRAIKIATKKNFQWGTMLEDCLLLDGIINGHSENVSSRMVLYYTTLRKPLCRLLALCSFIMTALVLVSELVLPFQQLTSSPLSVVALVVREPRLQFIGTTTFLFYMAFCSYWATFQFKVFDVFHVLPSVSDAASLCFTATFLTRLILPLCYNFLWIADLTDPEHLVTYSVLFGRMDVVDFLGPWFNRFIPIFIPIFAALIELKVFDRILQSMGIDRHDPNDLFSEAVKQKVADGRRLIQTHTGRELSTVSPSSASGADASSGGAGGGGMAIRVEKKAPAMERGQRYAEYKAKRAAAAATPPGSTELHT